MFGHVSEERKSTASKCCLFICLPFSLRMSELRPSSFSDGSRGVTVIFDPYFTALGRREQQNLIWHVKRKQSCVGCFY